MAREGCLGLQLYVHGKKREREEREEELSFYFILKILKIYQFIHSTKNKNIIYLIKIICF